MPIKRTKTNITTYKSKASSLATKKNGSKSSSKTAIKGKTKETSMPVFEPTKMAVFSKQYPDQYWKCHAESGHGMINYINEGHQLELINVDVHDQGPITGMTLSPDGTMLVTFSNVGYAKIWDTSDFRMIQKLRDSEISETQIDEFFVGKFTPDQTRIVVGGKLKDRMRWSIEDEDNHILPCPLKIFDVISGKVISRLDGHAEEILCVKNIMYKDTPYYITTSQDGYIIKWQMESDWTTLVSSKRMEDGITCMAFTVSFVPNTGNRYFLAATDEHIRLYDFEEAQLMQTFADMYSQYCDCGKFIHPVESLEEEDEDDDEIEILDTGDGTVASRRNVCILHKLIYPIRKGVAFRLEQVRKYQHEDYHANSWLMKISSNGRYLMAPTMTGQVMTFNLKTGKVSAILRDHEATLTYFDFHDDFTEDLEVRDVIFHPWKPLLFTCADDGCVKVYTYKDKQSIIASIKVKIKKEELQKSIAELNSIHGINIDPELIPIVKIETLTEGETEVDIDN
ncbi:10011_t:CDS:10 [Ambispora gerdemannii]|uniref:10011_t:CDS:1 n=1 Tax=Ambispora gerdemannii TaxID=144530 RepID=A0A9N9APW4_9GLOM|nr:10011_t:CDS:10 [Ambispora gerdemannii]